MSKVTLVVLGLAMVGLTIGSVVAANTDGSCKFKENGNYVPYPYSD